MAEIALDHRPGRRTALVFIVTGQLSALVPARRAAAIPPWAATEAVQCN